MAMAREKVRGSGNSTKPCYSETLAAFPFSLRGSLYCFIPVDAGVRADNQASISSRFHPIALLESFMCFGKLPAFSKRQTVDLDKPIFLKSSLGRIIFICTSRSFFNAAETAPVYKVVCV